MSACLDSWAGLAWLRGDEPANARVSGILVERPHMSWINAVEAAQLPIGLAGCSAIATAVAHGLPLLTGDPELLDRDDMPCAIEDLRPT